ncbi:MAG: hypothetical protein ACT4NP_08535 [Pseudonocardiales bacterium]
MSPGGFESFEGAFVDEVYQHLVVHCADDVEQEPGGWGGTTAMAAVSVRLRLRLRLPASVSMGTADRRLRLNLDDPLDLALPRAQLRRARAVLRRMREGVMVSPYLRRQRLAVELRVLREAAELTPRRSR